MAEITNTTPESIFTGTDDNDSLYNYASSATVDALAGNDYIYNFEDGSKSSLNGGAGNDSVYESHNPRRGGQRYHKQHRQERDGRRRRR